MAVNIIFPPHQILISRLKPKFAYHFLMAATAVGQPLTAEVGLLQEILEGNKISYANTLIAPKLKQYNIGMKPLT
ncbi:hypothetical protein H5410_050867 [Solanum commersonii]|uniref:Uncharacterized protein n=1 Tax=Solanum commersonii TaxID=4109 RepID=A0A9J5WZ91_SOLCO|nr:hypothetical protein H5410_050867 [Solanum commersonii]